MVRPARPLGYLLLTALAGCASVAPAPASIVAQYRAALAAGRYTEAHGLLSSELRAHRDANALARAHGEAPLAPASAPRQVRAEVLFAAEEPVPLVYEGGAWRLSSDLLDRFPQHTPLAALRSLARAVAERRFDLLPRFAPSRERAAWSRSDAPARHRQLAADLAPLRARLDDAAGLPVELLDGGRVALIDLDLLGLLGLPGPGGGPGGGRGGRRAVRLVLEDAAWCIDALR